MPIIAPIGIESPPTAVAITLLKNYLIIITSLSPNQTVAILLLQFINKG